MKTHGVLIVALLSCSVGYAQIEVPRLPNDISLDGHVDSTEWSSIPPVSLVSHWPSFGPTPNLNTKMRIAYDDNAVYVSATCFDDVNGVQSPTFERDKISMTQDNISLILDTFDDNENAAWFTVSPVGSRSDMSLKNDAQGDAPMDIAWNSYWEARSVQITNGWSAEMRIPFSSLRFQELNGVVTMGVILYRYSAKDRNLDIFPSISTEWGFWSFAKPSRAQNMIFRGIRNKRPWFTSPYILGRTGFHHEYEGNDYNKVKDNRITAGVDVQHAISDNVNLDLTVNTDFAQVEVDDQVVNLSRFSLFFPEKRKFFLERSSVMEFNFDNNNKLFYSRTIGIKNGKIVPIYGGVRVVGRADKVDFGFMNMQSRSWQGNPSENFGVFRLRRKISKTNSYIGAIVTSRADPGHTSNYTIGADAILNLTKSQYLKMNFARSFDASDSIRSSGFLTHHNRVYVQWENRSVAGLNHSLSYSRVDADYLPGLGFEIRQDYQAIGDKLAYGWFTKPGHSVRFVQVGTRGSLYFSNQRWLTQSVALSPAVTIEWQRNNALTVTYNRFEDHLPASFNLSDDIQVQQANYVNHDLTIQYNTPSVNFFTTDMSLTTGSFYGGQRLSFSLTPTYTLSKYLTLSGFYQHNRVDFGETKNYLSDVVRFKTAISLNVHLSINSFVQLNTLSNVVSFNFRLRYNWKDGNDLYVVYNEIGNKTGAADTGYLPDQRNFSVKYIYTFR